MADSLYKIYGQTQEAMDAMYQAILAAQQSIYWEVYTFVDDAVGKPFFAALMEKAKAGVVVRIIVDSLGSSDLSDSQVRLLRVAGVDIRFFKERTKKFRGWWKRLWSRTHRKILIIDERVGFIGGVNIRENMRYWLDIQVRVEGNIVRSLSRAFARSYVISGGDKQVVRHLFKKNFLFVDESAEFVFDEPHTTRSAARHWYTEALRQAQKRVILFSPYYFPDRKFLRALWQARRRGVKVDLLLPLRSDIRFMTWINYAWFALMDRLGVDIHLTPHMMHGKGAIMDDDWAMIGSSNLEKTSFYDNYEANIRLTDRKIVQVIKDKILSWIDTTEQFNIARWRERGWAQKIKEKIAVLLYRIWHGKK